MFLYLFRGRVGFQVRDIDFKLKVLGHVAGFFRFTNHVYVYKGKYWKLFELFVLKVQRILRDSNTSRLIKLVKSICVSE